MHLRYVGSVAVMVFAFSCDHPQISSITGQLDAPDDLIVTSDSIYFSESVTTASLNKMPITGGKPTRLVSDLPEFIRGSVTADDSALYWFSFESDGGAPAGALFSAHLDGQDAGVLAHIPDQYGGTSASVSGGHLFVEAGRLYWAARQQLWSMGVNSTTPTSLYEYAPTPDAGTLTRFDIVSVDARGIYFLDDTELKFMPLIGGAATVAVPVVPIVGFGGMTVTPTHAYWSTTGLAGTLRRAPLDGVDHPEAVVQQDGIALNGITTVASEGENVCFITVDIQFQKNTVQCVKDGKTVGLAEGSGRRFYGLQVHQGFAWFFSTTTGSTTAALFKVDINAGK